MKKMGKWIDTLFGSVGKFVHLETTDGVNREGKLTGLRTKTIKFNGTDQDVLMELELNGDPTDCVQLAAVVSLNLE
jgi:hypothetical protein